METAKLKKFAQFARRNLIDQVSAKMERVMAEDSPARRENAKAIKKLEEAIRRHGQEQVVERVAYIWFNRFCALRFMDVNRYTRIAVVSPAEGQFQPEILAEAKMGHIDEEMVTAEVGRKIIDLLGGKSPSRDPQGEVYSLLVVAACNSWNGAMPFLFERIDDYTELLIPDDLLSGKSILAYTREAMTPDACQDVEVIGWLYQFYISEKKDEVFEGLKKNRKITPANIPAATQLFTPHWIVRYLVENSLGRLWMLNRPSSRLIEQMDYYIKPQLAEAEFLRIASPEEIKICDPACGSGHMLTCAFDLLHAIYEEEGYDAAEIPEKILTHNLYGIEIDERAGELAAFALTMKARAKQRRYFRKAVLPNVCVLQNVQFDDGELKNYMDFVGRNLFTIPLLATLHQFEEADNFGSLIRPDVTNVADMLKILETTNVSGQLFLTATHQKVLKALQQAEYLRSQYHVVIANPPYLSSGNMNPRISELGKSAYSAGKADLFSMFIERVMELLLENGLSGVVTMQSWMFLSTFERLRRKIVKSSHIATLVQIGYNSFPELNSKVAQACAFVLVNGINETPGLYVNLNDAPQSSDKRMYFEKKKSAGHVFTSYQSNFLKITGCPIAYWINDKVFTAFEAHKPLGQLAAVKNGMSTTDNDRFTRLWYETSSSRIGFGFDNAQKAESSRMKWFPYNKGGLFRRWYGNFLQIVNWEDNGREIKKAAEGASGGRIVSEEYFFKESVSWSKVSTGRFAVRLYSDGFLFDVAGPSIFSSDLGSEFVLALLNSRTNHVFIEELSPTINYEGGQIGAFPVLEDLTRKNQIRSNTSSLVSISSEDWDSFETSWNFSNFPMLRSEFRLSNLKATYLKLRACLHEKVLEMQRLEEENNRIFIEAYGLQDDLKPDVPLSEITLTCNPVYRYNGGKTEEELDALLLADTMRELISYAVGCMFGRYALERSGLILANQGDTTEDYFNEVSRPSFPVENDNVIPMLDGDWFSNDIAERFRKFLRLAFGEEKYEENLRFIETALNVKGKRDYALRDYFLGEFFTDHVKRYKKRPIYWLFSSPKGSFNAFIYLHRYRPDTVSVVLNDYLREFRNKLFGYRGNLEAVSISSSAPQSEKVKALKDIEKVRKIIIELEEYERDVIYPLATKQLEIDLDDGVKVNYPKFGAALKKIPGLDSEEE